MHNNNNNQYFLVVDDENPTEVTAGAIVTVTVTLIRKNMSEIFGDETIKDTTNITENVPTDEVKENGKGDVEQVKKPAWVKQKKGMNLSNLVDV